MKILKIIISIKKHFGAINSKSLHAEAEESFENHGNMRFVDGVIKARSSFTNFQTFVSDENFLCETKDFSSPGQTHVNNFKLIAHTYQWNVSIRGLFEFICLGNASECTIYSLAQLTNLQGGLTFTGHDFKLDELKWENKGNIILKLSTQDPIAIKDYQLTDSLQLIANDNQVSIDQINAGGLVAISGANTINTAPKTSIRGGVGVKLAAKHFGSQNSNNYDSTISGQIIAGKEGIALVSTNSGMKLSAKLYTTGAVSIDANYVEIFNQLLANDALTFKLGVNGYVLVHKNGDIEVNQLFLSDINNGKVSYFKLLSGLFKVHDGGNLKVKDILLDRHAAPVIEWYIEHQHVDYNGYKCRYFAEGHKEHIVGNSLQPAPIFKIGGNVLLEVNTISLSAGAANLGEVTFVGTAPSIIVRGFNLSSKVKHGSYGRTMENCWGLEHSQVANYGGVWDGHHGTEHNPKWTPLKAEKCFGGSFTAQKIVNSGIDKIISYCTYNIAVNEVPNIQNNIAEVLKQITNGHISYNTPLTGDLWKEILKHGSIWSTHNSNDLLHELWKHKVNHDLKERFLNGRMILNDVFNFLSPGDMFKYRYRFEFDPFHKIGHGMENLIINIVGIENAADYPILLCKKECQFELATRYFETFLGTSNLQLISKHVREFMKLKGIDSNSPLYESDALLMNYLVENALKYKDKLGLEIGKPIQFDKISSHDEPFLWMVYNERFGIKTLEPVIYLPKELVDAAIDVRGTSVVIGEAENVKVKEVVSGGLLQINEGNLEADIIVNKGKFKAGQSGTVTLNVKEYFISQTPSYTSASNNNVHTNVGTQAEINTEYPIQLFVGKDFMAEGTKLHGKMIVKVEGKAYVIPTKIYTAFEHHFKRGYIKHGELHNLLSTVNGELQIEAKDDVYLEGLVATGELTKVKITSEGRVIETTAQEQNFHQEMHKKKGFIKSEMKVTTDFTSNNVGNNYGSSGQMILEHSVHSGKGTYLIGTRSYAQFTSLTAGTIENPADLVLTSAQDISFHEALTQKRGIDFGFKGGKFQYAKTIAEFTLNNDVTQYPTIIVSNHDTYLFAGGKYMQLSSEIDIGSNKLTIEAPKGAYIKSLDDERLRIVKVTEGSIGVGFTATKREMALKFGIDLKSHSNREETFTPVASKIKAEQVAVIVKQGMFLTQGVQFKVKELIIEAIKHIDLPSFIKYFQSSESTVAEINLKLGIRSSLADSIDATKNAKEQDSSGKYGAINKVSSIYGAFGSWISTLLAPVEGGLYIEASFEHGKMKITRATPLVSIFEVDGVLRHKAEEVNFEGTNITALKWFVDAEQFKITSAFDSFEMQYKNQAGQMVIPLYGTIKPSAGFSTSVQESGGKRSYNAKINVGDFEVTLSGALTIEGANIEARTIKIDVGSLLIKSSMDLVFSKGNNFGVGVGDINKIQQIFSSINGQVQRSDSNWVTELTTLIGSEKVEIIVGQSLKVVGAMIANAERNTDGTLTDKGRMTIKYGELVLENLYGYDKGKLLGGSYKHAFQETDKNGEARKNVFGSGGGVDHAEWDDKQTVKPTIGKTEEPLDGNIIGNDKINRDINNPIDVERQGSRDELHARYTHINYGQLANELENYSFKERVLNGLKPMTDLFGEVMKSMGFGSELDPKLLEAVHKIDATKGRKGYEKLFKLLEAKGIKVPEGMEYLSILLAQETANGIKQGMKPEDALNLARDMVEMVIKSYGVEKLKKFIGKEKPKTLEETVAICKSSNECMTILLDLEEMTTALMDKYAKIYLGVNQKPQEEKPKVPNKDNSKRDDFETFEEIESREDAAEIEELEALREMIASWDYEDSVKLAKARISGEKGNSGNGFLNLLVSDAEASDGSKPKEEEGWISKESKKYFSKKLVEYLAKPEAEKHGLELIMAIIGYDLHMVGAGISEVEKEFPKLGKAVDKITEILNKPFEMVGEKISNGYSAAKEGLISEIGERYGSAKADEVTDYIAFKERAVGQELYKFAPDEKQERTLKYMEVIGVGKLLKEMSLVGVKKLYEPADIKKLFEKDFTYPENIAEYQKYKIDLLRQEAASIFEPSGHLKKEFVDEAKFLKLEGGISNKYVIDILTKDGSNLNDWGKFVTKSEIRSPVGNIQVHFYKNKINGKVIYDIDYKSKFGDGKK